MGMYNRYYIVKKKHQEYLVVIVRKGKYFSCSIDDLILKQLKKNVNIEHQLQDKHIYIVSESYEV